MINQKGFTLVELVTTLAVVGIASGLLYTVFFMNWQAFDQNISRADLGGELQKAVEFIENDSRYSKQINVVNTATTKQAIFVGQNNAVLAVYTLNSNGQILFRRNQPVDNLLSDKLDFTRSSFIKNGSALQITLAFIDTVFGRQVNLNSSLEVYPRN